MNEYLYSMSANPNPKTILRIDEVLHRTGLKRTMLYDLIRKEEFPKQVSLGARAVGWCEEQVEEWINNRSAAGSSQVRREQELVVETQPTPSVFSQVPEVEGLKTALRPSIRARKKTSELVENSSAEFGEPAGANRNCIATHTVRTSTGGEELLHLRDENARLKRLVADLILKNDLLESAIRK